MKQKKFICLATIFTLASTLLVGCGNSKPSEQVLNVYNVGDYIDESLITKFEEETGIEVVYETYDTNESMYQKVKGGSSKYDLVFPSDYMVQKMINEDMLEKINYNNIPNYKYISKEFKNAPYDKGDKYSVPYMWGTFGILYNKNIVDEKDVKSWDVLWNKKYAGEIQMLDSVRDTMGISLKRLGYSMNSENPKEIEKAKEQLILQKPIVQAYVNDDGKDRLVSGEAAIGIVYSGDATYIMSENENMEFAIPKEGSNMWVDSMVIPSTAQNVELAHKFINFMQRPDIALMNTEYVMYSTPNMEVLNMVSDEAWTQNEAYSPSQELLASLPMETFRDPGEFIKEYDNIWTQVLAASK